MLKSVLLYPSKSSGIFRQCSKFKLAIPPSAEVCNNTNVKIVYNDPAHAQLYEKLEHFFSLRKHAMDFKKSREKIEFGKIQKNVNSYHFDGIFGTEEAF